MWMWLLTKFSIYHTFITSSCRKNSFFEVKKFKLITWYPNMVQIMWNGMIQYSFNFQKNQKLFKWFLEFICVFEYIGTLHWFSQIYYNLRLYKMKWNSFFPNILSKLYIEHNMQKYCEILSKVWNEIHSNMHTPRK
jgi:hypothetical protein